MAGDEKAAQTYALLLEPGEHSDDFYVAMRRLLLLRKAQAGRLRRQTWKANGVGYVAYKDFLRHSKRGFPAGIGEHANTLREGKQSASESTDRPSSPQPAKPADVPFMKAPLPVSQSLIVPPSREQARKILLPEDKSSISFAGIYCTIGDCKSSVNCMKFGHLSLDLFAYAASNGVFRVCLIGQPPRVLHDLKGHTKEITDFDWSLNNHYLSSASMDKSVRVWDASLGECLRIIYGNVAQLCIRFHSVNNNLLLVGNANKEITVMNFSTGRTVSRLALESPVTAMDVSTTGPVLFAGDAQGCIHSFGVDPHTGALQHAHANHLGNGRRAPTASLQFRTFSFLASGSVLLACTRDGSLRFFSVAMELDGYLSLKCTLQLSPRAHNIRASFCPFLTPEKSEIIVTGSDDHNVYFYDFTQPKRPLTGKLQGHGAPVVDVCWNHGEDLLASSDCDGLIIIWKRNKSL